MSLSRVLTVAACSTVLLLATSCDKKRSAPHVVPDDAAAKVDAARSTSPAPSPENRRLSDIHMHLSPLAYPVLVPYMDDLGIHRVVNMSGGFREETRQRQQEMRSRFPGRFAPFMNVDWRDVNEPGFGDDIAENLRASVRDGYAGLKISKALGLSVEDEDGEFVAVDDARLDPIWSAAGELGVPVGIHTSDPKAFFEKPGPQNERHEELSLAPSWSFYGEEYPSRKALLDARDRMVKKHPETTFILLHFANNPEDVDYVDKLLDENPNVMVDIAARIGEIGRHDAGKVRRIFVKHQDRIMFATDLQLSVRPQGKQLAYRLTLGSISEEPPTLDDLDDFYQDHFDYFEKSGEPIEHPVPIQGDWKVNPIDLPPEVLRKVYFENAERVIFAPWLARNDAFHVSDRATSLAAGTQ